MPLAMSLAGERRSTAANYRTSNFHEQSDNKMDGQTKNIIAYSMTCRPKKPVINPVTEKWRTYAGNAV